MQNSLENNCKAGRGNICSIGARGYITKTTTRTALATKSTSEGTVSSFSLLLDISQMRWRPFVNYDVRKYPDPSLSKQVL